MKIFTVIAVSAALSLAAAEKLTLTQAPEAVQKTVNRQRGQVPIKSIEQKRENGKIVYEVEFSERGMNTLLWIGQDGSVLREFRPELVTPGGPIPITSPRRPLTLADLPQAVQKTIHEKSAGRTIAEIATEHWRGNKVYQIEFQQPGPNEQIHIADDGTIFKDERFLSAVGSLLKGTQLSETPGPVLETVRREVAGQKVKNVDTKRRNGQTIYEVEVEQTGKNYELFVAQDGTILRDSRKEAAGDSAGSQLGFGKSVELSETPPSVQERIKAQTDGGQIVKIHQRSRDDKTVYDVEFVKKGINDWMEIDESGAILKDNVPPR